MHLDVASWSIRSLADIDQDLSMTSLSLSCPNLASGMEAISKFRSLRELKLDCQALASLPPDIGTLSNLRSFEVASPLLRTIPQEIEKLSSLESLAIRCPALQALPELDRFPMLTYVQIWCAHAKTAAQALVGMTGDVEITLNRNLEVTRHQIMQDS